MKNIYKNSFIYIFLGFLAPGVNFFLLPIYTRELSAQEFGIITLATIFQAFLANLTSLGINGAFSRIYFDYDNSIGESKVLFTAAWLIQLLAGLIIHGLMLVIGDFLLGAVLTNNEFTYSKYGKFIGITSIAVNIQALILCWYRNKEQPVVYAIWAVFFFLAQATGIALGIIVMHKGALGNIEGRMWGGIIPLFVYTVMNYRMFRLKPKIKIMSRSMISFGLPLVVYMLLMLAYNNIDKILLESHFDLDLLGLYGFAFMIASIAEIFLNAIQSAIYPKVVKELSKDQPNYKNISTLYSVFIITNLLIISLLISFSGFIIDLFISSKYHAVLGFLPLLCISYIPRIFAIILMNGVSIAKKTNLMPIASIISLFAAWMIGSLLLSSLGLWAILLAVILSQTVQMLVFLFFNQKYRLQSQILFRLKKGMILSAVLFSTTILATIGFYVWANQVFFLSIFIILVAGIATLYRKSLSISILKKIKNTS